MTDREMSPAPRVSCVLCTRSEETKVTGALLTKGDVTAHQNCLVISNTHRSSVASQNQLYASGICCSSSPEFDDLFGFSVSDVKGEVRRGNRLVCGKCNKKGATAGCEVKRCKKSYHYPCAIEDNAKTTDEVDEKYGLYCPKHCQQTGDGAGASNGHSDDPTAPGPSKVFCLTCEETEGNIPLDHVSNGITLSYCDQHAPSSHKENTSGDSTSARLSASDSNSNSGISKKSSRKRLSFTDRSQEPPAKSTANTWNRIITDNSLDSDEDQPDGYMAPIESDGEYQEDGHRQTPEDLTGPPSGSPPQIMCNDDTGDETDAESESLLQSARRCPGQQLSSATNETASQTKSPAARIWKLEEVEVFPVFADGSSIELSQDQHPDGPSVSDQSSIGPPASSDLPNGLVNSPHGTISPMPPDATPPPAALPSDPEPDVDAASFWRSCSAAGCTRAIFVDFIQEITDISSRIQSEEASQEDYDLALKVMKASGKLEELVTRQQKELERKQMELQKAVASMQKVVSAMRR